MSSGFQWGYVLPSDGDMGPSGGPGGDNWFLPLDHTPLTLDVSYGDWIDGLVLTARDPATDQPRIDPTSGEVEQTQVGGTGSQGPDTVRLDAGAVLLELSGTYGNFVNSLHFRWRLSDGSEQVADTVGGRSAPWGSSFWYLAPPGLRIIALFGRAGRYLDAIGVSLDTIP